MLHHQDMGANNIGQETKRVKIGHVKIDRAHFRVYFRDTGKFPVSTGKCPVSTLVGVFVGTLWCVLH